jgi:hypothetical protein
MAGLELTLETAAHQLAAACRAMRACIKANAPFNASLLANGYIDKVLPISGSNCGCNEVGIFANAEEQSGLLLV